MNISCDFHYDAAHWLPNVPRTHKCGRMHGHTYHLTVTVSGDLQAGWVMDFADVKDKVQPWLARLDHRVLNEEIDNPTSEIQLMWWWDRLSQSIPGLCELRLREGVSNTASYRREN